MDLFVPLAIRHPSGGERGLLGKSVAVSLTRAHIGCKSGTDATVSAVLPYHTLKSLGGLPATHMAAAQACGLVQAVASVLTPLISSMTHHEVHALARECNGKHAS